MLIVQKIKVKKKGKNTSNTYVMLNIISKPWIYIFSQFMSALSSQVHTYINVSQHVYFYFYL